MPLREMRRRFTKSEIMIMGWRSAETAYNMRVGHGDQNVPDTRPTGNTALTERYSSGFAQSDDVLEKLEARLGPVAYKLENKDGEVDLRRLTGDEAMHYFQAMGIPIGGRM